MALGGRIGTMIQIIIALILSFRPICPPRCVTPHPFEPTVVLELPTKTPTIMPTPQFYQVTYFPIILSN